MINVVIVTYGDRWHLLVRVLDSLCDLDIINKIILVDNKSDYDVLSHCKNKGFSKVEVVSNGQNNGSAGGFFCGISKAICDPERLILLLDDDNFPRDGAVRNLLVTYNQQVVKYDESLFAVATYRESQHGRFRMPIKPPYKLGHDFLGFNVFNVHQRYLGLLEYYDLTESGSCFASFNRGNPYGGLLFSPKLIDKVGLPRKELVLYFDDIEFTSRIIDSGGVVWVDFDSVVDDIEKNYSGSLFNTPIIGFVMGGDDEKIFYIIRNKIYIDKYLNNKISIYYNFNKLLFLVLVCSVSVLSFKWTRLFAVCRAAYGGSRGVLGFHPKYPL